MIATYIDNFVPGALRRNPKFNIACYGACGQSDAAAADFWSKAMTFKGRTMPAGFVGDPLTCASQLLGLCETYGADEVVIHCFAPNSPEKMNAYAELIKAVDATSAGKQTRKDETMVEPHKPTDKEPAESTTAADTPTELNSDELDQVVGAGYGRGKSGLAGPPDVGGTTGKGDRPTAADT